MLPTHLFCTPAALLKFHPCPGGQEFDERNLIIVDDELWKIPLPYRANVLAVPTLSKPLDTPHVESWKQAMKDITHIFEEVLSVEQKVDDLRSILRECEAAVPYLIEKDTFWFEYTCVVCDGRFPSAEALLLHAAICIDCKDTSPRTFSSFCVCCGPRQDPSQSWREYFCIYCRSRFPSVKSGDVCNRCSAAVASEGLDAFKKKRGIFAIPAHAEKESSGTRPAWPEYWCKNCGDLFPMEHGRKPNHALQFADAAPSNEPQEGLCFSCTYSSDFTGVGVRVRPGGGWPEYDCTSCGRRYPT